MSDNFGFSSYVQVRVNALLCFGELVQTLDKHAVLEILQTIQRCTAVDRSAPTLMCTLGVANSILKQVLTISSSTCCLEGGVIEDFCALLELIYLLSKTCFVQYGIEFIAEHVLPLLVPLLTAQQLNVQQFAKYMLFVKDILR